MDKYKRRDPKKKVCKIKCYMYEELNASLKKEFKKKKKKSFASSRFRAKQPTQIDSLISQI